MTRDANPIIVLIGTKSDLSRVVTSEEIRDKAREWGCKYYVISCKEEDSLNMIRRIFFMSCLDFHRKILSDKMEGKPLPKSVITKPAIFNIHEPRGGHCCFQ